MPNYVKNIVTVSEETMNKIKEKYFKMGILSFEKIIPMPKRLHLIDGYITDASIYYTWSKKSEIERKWYIIDAANKPLGRVAAEAAKLLRGKHKPTYTPNMDAGDHVIIINCSEVVLTGHKLTQKIYRHHSTYIGGMKEIQAKDMLANNPEKMMTLAVTGMLPHNSLGRQMAKKLRVYAGAEHENMAQKPEIWNF